jgi:aspartate racemase
VAHLDVRHELVHTHGIMRQTKTIGVLGGMGPAATADFFQKLIQATPAQADQDHLKVLIFSNPHIPDRTAAIRGEGPDPLAALVGTAKALIRAGADFLTMPCVTAHHFYDGLQAAIDVPLLHLVRETVAAAADSNPAARCFGLLATSGTLRSRMFERTFEPHGLAILTCEPAVQTSCVMEAIYGVKQGQSLDRPRRLIREAAAHLQERGVEAIIAGCTEIPLILRDGDLPVPVLDPSWILAQAAVRLALTDTAPPPASQRCYKDRG